MASSARGKHAAKEHPSTAGIRELSAITCRGMEDNHPWQRETQRRRFYGRLLVDGAAHAPHRALGTARGQAIIFASRRSASVAAS